MIKAYSVAILIKLQIFSMKKWNISSVTVCKFSLPFTFYVNIILVNRKIQKGPILTVSEALNFDFQYICAFNKAEIFKRLIPEYLKWPK